MKPKRYKPEFAIQATMEDNARRFVFPDLDTLPTPGIPGGGGGAFSIQIAASDAHDIEKEKADIIADLTDGGAAIQTAADTIHDFGNDPNGRGLIRLSSGIFKVPNADVLNLGNSIDIEGTGEGTIIQSPATSGTILTLGGGCSMRYLNVAGGSGTSVGVEAEDVCYFDRVLFFSLGTAIIPGDLNTITRCAIPFPGAQPVQTFIDATAVVFDLILANNLDLSNVALGASTTVLIIGNEFVGGVTADGGGHISVIGNYNIASGGIGLATFANVTDFIIANNNWLSSGFDGIILDTCTKGIVEGNYFGESPDTGIILDTCTNLVVQGNYLEFPAIHGIQLIDSDDCSILGNYVKAALTDNYRIAGDRNLVMGNHSIPTAGFSTADFGINIVSGNDNAVYANYLGDSSAYGTADSVDSGTGTQTSPAAGVIGGQFAF